MSFHFNPKLVIDGLIWAMDIANPTSFTPPNGGSNTSINDLTIYNSNFTLILSSTSRPYTRASSLIPRERFESWISSSIGSAYTR